MDKKIKYIKPKKYHVVIRDITNYIDKMVNDPRDTDSFFFHDEIKDTLNVLKHELLRSDKDLDMKMVYGISIQLISFLIVQTSLFGRICIENETYVDGKIENLITLPRNHVPMFFKQGLEKGKSYDYTELHTLKTMKEWYDKIMVNKSIREIMNGE